MVVGADTSHLFASCYYFFLYGHRHIELDLMLSKKTRMMILGDWIWQFTYAVFDGEHMFMEQYVEGESQP